MAGEALVDLRYLTRAEKEGLHKVARDDIQFVKENLSNLESSVKNGKNFQSQNSLDIYSGKICCCCGCRSGTICERMRSYKCSQCKQWACKNCVRRGKKKTFCKICQLERYFDLHSEELKKLNDLSSFSESEAYGSYLILRSLEAIGTQEPARITITETVLRQPRLATPDGQVDMATSDGHSYLRDGYPKETGSPAYIGDSKNGDIHSSQADDQRYPADGHPGPANGNQRIISRQSPVGSDSPLLAVGADSHLSPAHILSKENSLDLTSPTGKYRAKAGSLTGLTVPPITDGFTVLKSAESDEEIGSLYSEPCYDNDLDKLGSVKLAVWYRSAEAILYVKIHSASDLTSTKGKEVNPYIKVHLLPGQSKHTKRKTGMLRNTKNPEFNEIVKYKMSREELNNTTVWLSVWDWDRMGRNNFLGEVRLPLFAKDRDLSNSDIQKYKLKEYGGNTLESVSSGRITIALMYEYKLVSRCPSLQPSTEPSKSEGTLGAAKLDTGNKVFSKTLGDLHINVVQAEDLSSNDMTGDTNPFVRCYLLPNKSLSAKRKTTTIPKTLNPVWNEECAYNSVNFDDTKNHNVLEVSVWDNDRRGASNFMGGIRLGPSAPAGAHAELLEWMDSTDEEASHWEEALANPGTWVERTHVLRSTMSSRFAMKKSRKQDADHEGSNMGSAYPVEGGAYPVEGGADLAKREGAEETSAQRSEKPSTSSKKEASSKIMELGVHRLDKGDYEISGEVVLGVDYRDNKLMVKVSRARRLAEARKGSSDPYVKLYLLPDLTSKKKTKVKKRTVNPLYDQIFTYKVSEDRLKSSTLWVSVWDNEGVLAHNLFLGETSICFESHEFDDTPLREFSYKLTDYSTMPMMPRSEHGMKYRVYSGRNAHSAELDELEETKPVPFVEAEVEKVTTEENLAAGNGEAEVEPVEAIPTKEEADEEKSAPPDVHEEEPKTLEGEAQVEEPAEMLEEQLVEAVPTQQLESTLEADPVEVKSKKDDKKEKKEREKREKKERKEKEKEQKRKKRSSKVPEEATLSPDPEPVDVQEEEPAQPQEGEIREEQVVPEEGGEVHVAPPVAITLEADPEVKSKSDDKKEKKEREKREKKEKKEKEKEQKRKKRSSKVPEEATLSPDPEPVDVQEEEPAQPQEGEIREEQVVPEEGGEVHVAPPVAITLEADPEVKSKSDDKKEKKEREKREKKERKEKEKEQKRKKRSSKVPEEATLSPDPEPVDVQEEEPAQPQEGEIREEQVVPEEGGEVHVAPPVATTLEADDVKSKKDDKKEKKEREKREKKERKEKEKEQKRKKRSSKVPEEATLSPDPEPVDVQEEEPAQHQEGETREEQTVPEEGDVAPVATTLEADPVEVKSKKANKKEKKKEKKEKKEKKGKKGKKTKSAATPPPEEVEEAAAEERSEGIRSPSVEIEVIEREEDAPLPVQQEDAPLPVQQENAPLPEQQEDTPSTAKVGSGKPAKPDKSKKSSKKSEEPKRVQKVAVTASTRPSKAKK